MVKKVPFEGSKLQQVVAPREGDPGFIGPVRPSVPSDFIGPLPPGVRREPGGGGAEPESPKRFIPSGEDITITQANIEKTRQLQEAKRLREERAAAKITEAQRERFRRRGLTKLEEQLGRVERGELKSFKSPFIEGKVTKERVGGIRSALLFNGEEDRAEERPILPGDTPTEARPITPFEDKTFETKPKSFLDKFVELPGVRTIKEFEEKKVKRRKEEGLSELEKLNIKLTGKRGKPEPSDKKNLATRLDLKATQILKPIEQEIAKLFPEGEIKEFLFEPRGLVPVSDLSKFVFFAPAFATTSEALATALRLETITPETAFVAKVKPSPKGKGISEVDVATLTKVGEAEVKGFSKQLAKDIGDDAVLGAGKGIVKTDIREGVEEFVRFNILGGAKTGGKAVLKRPSKIGEFKVTQEIPVGLGIEARTFTQEFDKIIIKKGIGRLPPSRELLFTEARFGFGKPKFTRKPERGDITGFLKQSDVDDSVFLFAGKTGKATTRISKEGISKILDDINVRGKIFNIEKDIRFFRTGELGIKGLPPPSPFKFPRLPRGKRGSLVPVLSRAQQESALIQASALTQQAEKQLMKQLEIGLRATTTKPKISISPFEIERNLSRGLQRTRASGREAIRERIDISDRALLGSASLSKQKAKTKQKAVTITKPRISQKALTEELTTLKLGSLLNLKQLLRTGRGTRIPLIPIKIKIPKTPKIPLLIPFGLKGKRRKAKKPTRRLGKEDIIISQGFTARTLGFKPITIKEADIGKLDKQLREVVGIRRGVIIKRNRKKK